MVSSLIAFCHDWEQKVTGRRQSSGSGRIPQGQYAKIVECLAEVGTWDRLEFHGTRVVTGDVVGLKVGPRTYRRPELLELAARLPLRLRWTRGPAWGFLKAVTGLGALGSLDLGNTRIEVSPGDTVTFHAVGEKEPSARAGRAGPDRAGVEAQPFFGRARPHLRVCPGRSLSPRQGAIGRSRGASAPRGSDRRATHRIHSPEPPAATPPWRGCGREGDSISGKVGIASWPGGLTPPGYVLAPPSGASGTDTQQGCYQSLGSTGSLSRASTPKTHSWTRRNGSRRTNRSSPSTPRANSPSASDRFRPRPRDRRRSRFSSVVYSGP